MNEFFQGEGVLDGEAIGIVVEIDKNILAFLCPAFDLLNPSLQLFVLIIRTVENFSPVEA
jgi:hypothetical protein